MSKCFEIPPVLHTVDTGFQKRFHRGWVARRFWTAEERENAITLRELRAVGLLLAQCFSDYVSDPQTTKILVHEDNRAVVSIVHAMVSTSEPMMAELHKLRALLHELGVNIQAKTSFRSESLYRYSLLNLGSRRRARIEKTCTVHSRTKTSMYGHNRPLPNELDTPGGSQGNTYRALTLLERRLSTLMEPSRQLYPWLFGRSNGNNRTESCSCLACRPRLGLHVCRKCAVGSTFFNPIRASSTLLE